MLRHFAILLVSATASSAFAQGLVLPPAGNVVIVDRSVQIGGTPQSLLVGAYGRYLRDAAVADYVEQHAIAQAIQNRVLAMEARLKMVQFNHEIRNEKWEQEMLERRQKLAEKIDTLDRWIIRYMELPVEVAEARTARGLNTLLEQLPSSFGEFAGTTVPVPLDSGVIGDLRAVIGVGKQKSRVALNGDGFPCDPPRSLRKLEGAAALLERYEAARTKILDKLRGGARADDQAFDDATAALDELEKLLLAHRNEVIQSGEKLGFTDPRFVAHSEGMKFIKEQIQQTMFLVTQKRLPAKFQGNTVQELIAYMKSHGYQFAAAEDGAENSYKLLFDAFQKLFKELKNPPLAPRFREVLPEKGKTAGRP